ncbi:glycosyltransferase family protein [Angustibacter sp. McL0619]|uniref:glycosyltransferase family protein n=1 Tax=Angustibacter sp. McL0619 TaxID=3415676 RepID=UPI003CEE0743
MSEGSLENDLLRQRIAELEAQLAVPRQSRLGVAARVVRTAVRQPNRRRALPRDLAKALVDPPERTVHPRELGKPPRVELPDGPVARPGLVVATILDTFSELCLRYEWDQLTFGPDDWRQVLPQRRPDLLFVESAWNGNDGRWRLHMTRDGRPSEELRALVSWCQTNGIPTVFWNKEDPPNYDVFIETAKLFDQVFTVDAERIPDYHRDLGHERVALLAFAAQPRIHNPVERGAGRVRELAFAGTYFAEKHAERREQMDYLLRPASELGLHIYSRLQSDDPRYRFPKDLVPFVVGSLDYDQMVGAYSSYKVFINVNSVTGSPTMCSRRLFELSAAQTAVVSAPAASVQPFFGDTIRVVQDADQARQEMTALVRHRELRDRVGLRAHRRVFDEHLYTHRVDDVLRAVGLQDAGGLTRTTPRAPISAVVATNRPQQLENVMSFIGRQVHPDVQLVLVQHGFATADDELARLAHEHGVRDYVALEADAALTLGACMNLGVDAADGTFVAKMDDDNLYLEHYLSDLVRAFSFTDAEVVGKWAHLVHLEGSNATLLRFPHAEHRYTQLVQGGTILTRRETAARLRFEDLPRRVDTTFLDKVHAGGGTVFSADRFNFVSVRRPDPASHTWTIPEEQLLAGQAELLFYGDPTTHARV